MTEYFSNFDFILASYFNLLRMGDVRNKACWLTLLKKSTIFIKIFLLKLKNAEGAVITVMVETSFKYLISFAICVGVLKLLGLFAILGLHKIKFV